MYDKILIDSTEVIADDFVDIDFLMKKELLVKQFNGNLKVNFVGEVITPNSKIISLPKNFQPTERNIKLTVDILKKFRSLAKDGKTLIENRSFVSGSETTSDVFFFKSFKKYFTDHITYDFISPKKKIKKHTTIPMLDSFDVVDTEMNVERFGSGLTYKLKNKNNKDWNSEISLSDVYFSTVQTYYHSEYASITQGGISGVTDTSCPNLKMYSFALKASKHQPCGTCNFSRIDTAQLYFTGDYVSALNIYAVNYNVLRIMSGMGGLAYSN
jgi:hypothetical protein